MSGDGVVHMSLTEALAAEVEARRANEALLAASLKRADAEVERLRAENQLAWNTAEAAEAERDRLRAVLADTPRNEEAVSFYWNSNDGESAYIPPGSNLKARRVLAALRARAALEPTLACPHGIVHGLGCYSCEPG